MLGYSVERRPIVAWLVAASDARRSVLVVGSIAGDEPGGIAVTRILASQAAIAGVRLWLIPDANPDGAARGTRGNADGVDLNRNFPYRWRHLGAPGSRYYSGPRAASEPESRAIEAFLRRTRPGLPCPPSLRLRCSEAPEHRRSASKAPPTPTPRSTLQPTAWHMP